MSWLSFCATVSKLACGLVLPFWESGVSLQERCVNRCDQLLFSHLLSQTVSRSQAFGQTWVLWCWVRVTLPEFRGTSQVMALLIIINQYADIADALYFVLSCVFISRLQQEWHPPLLLIQCFLNLVALTFTALPKLTPEMHCLPAMCACTGLCVIHIVCIKYMVRCVCVCVCTYVSESVYHQLLDTLGCTVCYCHSFLCSPPEREAKCPLSRIAVHFHE